MINFKFKFKVNNKQKKVIYNKFNICKLLIFNYKIDQMIIKKLIFNFIINILVI